MWSSGRSCPSGLSVPTTLNPNDLHLPAPGPEVSKVNEKKNCQGHTLETSNGPNLSTTQQSQAEPGLVSRPPCTPPAPQVSTRTLARQACHWRGKGQL